MDKTDHVFESPKGKTQRKPSKNSMKKAGATAKKGPERDVKHGVRKTGGGAGKVVSNKKFACIGGGGKKAATTTREGGTKKKEVTYTSDGFPRNESEYEPMEGKYVYRPPGYPAETKNMEGLSVLHCTMCHLKPCIATALDSKIWDLCHQHIAHAEWEDRCLCSESGYEDVQREHCILFMKRYRINNRKKINSTSKTSTMQCNVYK
ncbi:hypothetical protein SEMRO_1480_G276200.1 [Seminavis robusta]|uniref:Uncharacterized protein n=1 Tax=Seminavis robusta TaxID=568900 RepID=A0A9N8ESM6_9STRA|nr:hypothetical protein SEMRO_1480_G276200.1 [Seminavis robusta]|eukprot:Sro1480_g276200.1 n/a (206) ;mRNA; f:21354-21971